jgi:dTDP-L-rhamnose 4-epimerase
MPDKNIGTVLVTGGAGFIGSALSHALAGAAERWVALDSLHPQVHATAERPADLHPDAELVVGDVTRPNDWDSLLAEVTPDVIVHLAAETGTAQSLDEASRHAMANVVGTTEMLDALGRAGVSPQHILLSSSRAVYGEGAWQKEDGEVFYPGQRSHDQLAASVWDFPGATSRASSASATVPTPTSIYGATKLAQENILRAWGSSRSVPVSILRLQNVYGPGQSLINSYTGIVSLFSQLARDGRSIPLYEDGDITRDFVYITDIADAFAATILAGPNSQRPVLDIGSGVATTIRQLAEEIADYYGAPGPHVVAKFRDGDVRHASCSIATSLHEIDWAPRVSLKQGLAELQVWIAGELTNKTDGASA